jgi:tight adherence protein B
MWQQAAQIHTVSEAAQGDVPPRRAATVRARFQGGELPSADAAVLAAAARAAAMGRPVGPAMRAALAADQRRVRPRRGGWGGPWTSVAACMETAEASGSPLAAVLERLAAQFEADADAAAARAVALAGPRATAQVLSFLPAAGLLLGALMGADPLGLLLSTPLGAGCLALGLVLTAAGRWWSARMVRSASEVR